MSSNSVNTTSINKILPSEKFPIPNWGEVVGAFGSYTVVYHENSAYLCGAEIRDMSKSYPVSEITIKLMNKEMIDRSPSNLKDYYKLDNNEWYYIVTVSEYVFLFEHNKEALEFIYQFLKAFKISLKEDIL
jgi:hypothetical protein